MLTKERIIEIISKAPYRNELIKYGYGEYRLYKDAYQSHDLAFKNWYLVNIKDGKIILTQEYREGYYIKTKEAEPIIFDCHFAADDGLTRFHKFVLNVALKDRLTRKNN